VLFSLLSFFFLPKSRIGKVAAVAVSKFLARLQLNQLKKCPKDTDMFEYSCVQHNRNNC